MIWKLIIIASVVGASTQGAHVHVHESRLVFRSERSCLAAAGTVSPGNETLRRMEEYAVLNVQTYCIRSEAAPPGGA